MGTRADFYVGTGPTAEWIGSIGWDGHPEGVDTLIMASRAEDGFRKAVSEFLARRDDATQPDQGWPWPWNDSTTTDYAYCFQDKGIRTFCFGREVLPTDDEDAEERRPKADFPNMADRKNVTLGRRSGLIIVSAP